MMTLKITFKPTKLPASVPWLARHVMYVSGHSETDVWLEVNEAINRHLEKFDLSIDDFRQIFDAMVQDVMPWTASVFDMFRIDVSAERAAG
jgi:hypothetical protein